MLWLALPLMGGIAWGRLVAEPTTSVALVAAAGCGAAAIAAVWRGPRTWMTAIVATMLFAGIGTYRLHDHRLSDWDGLPPREGQMTLRIDRTFPRQDATATGIGTVITGHGATRELAQQRVYFSFRLRPGDERLVRSAVVRCRGVLTPVPPNPDAGTFDGYLRSAGIYFRFGRGRIVGYERPPSAYYLFLEHAATRLTEWLGLGVAAKRPALTAVFRAMMLGQKHELSAEQNDRFMRSGTMHLFAINGLHIGVVALALHALFSLLRWPRWLLVPVTLAILWFDVDTTGASPSAVRAFLLVACAEAGFLLRRPANGLATLSAAATLVLLFDPLALFSASFQMSYGVVFAILTYGLPAAEAAERRWQPFSRLPRISWSRRQRAIAAAVRWWWPVAGIGVAALLVSTIAGPEFFQVLAPVGFFSNLLLIPLATLVIIAGVSSVLAAALAVSGVNLLFNHAAIVVLGVIDGIVSLSAQLPNGSWTAHWRWPAAAPLALTVLFVTLLAGYARGWRGWVIAWWTPALVVAVAVATGVRLG